MSINGSALRSGAMQIGRRPFGFQLGWNTQNSAHQNLTMQRARVANYLGSMRFALNSASTALASAATSQISGLANIASQQAMDRMKAQMAAALATRDKHLADAQASLQATQSSYNSSGLAMSGSDGSGGVVDSSA